MVRARKDILDKMVTSRFGPAWLTVSAVGKAGARGQGYAVGEAGARGQGYAVGKAGARPSQGTLHIAIPGVQEHALGLG